MASSLSYLVKATIGGGPSFLAQDRFDTESFIFTQVTVPAAGATVAVGAGAMADIQLIGIAVDAYKDAAGAFQVTMQNALAGSPTITLEGPIMLVGAGAVSLLGTAIESLVFMNATGEDRTVTILVARNA